MKPLLAPHYCWNQNRTASGVLHRDAGRRTFPPYITNPAELKGQTKNLKWGQESKWGKAFHSAILAGEAIAPLNNSADATPIESLKGSENRRIEGLTPCPTSSDGDVQRRTGATGICQRICKAHIFDETFGVNSAFQREGLRRGATSGCDVVRLARGESQWLLGLKDARSKDYTVKVYPNGSHNLMEVPPDNPNEWVRLKRFPPGFFETMVDWTTTQLRRRAPARR